MSKKRHTPVTTKKAVIDINGKEKISVDYDVPAISAEEYEAEIKRIEEAIARIRKTQYSTNVALRQVQSRKLRELASLQVSQLLDLRKTQKKRNIGF